MTQETSAPDDGDIFYSQALARLQRIMMVLCIGGLATAWPYFGWRTGLGFAVGSVIASLNFYWLKQVVSAIAERTVESGVPASSGGIVHRFLLRYFLMAILGFAILTVSRESLYGFFAGLSVPVAAILCEAVYQTYNAVASG
jgi:hypothetical protein